MKAAPRLGPLGPILPDRPPGVSPPGAGGRFDRGPGRAILAIPGATPGPSRRRGARTVGADEGDVDDDDADPVLRGSPCWSWPPASGAWGDDEPKAKPPAPPATVRATPGAFRVVTALKGVIESDRMEGDLDQPRGVRAALDRREGGRAGGLGQEGRRPGRARPVQDRPGDQGPEGRERPGRGRPEARPTASCRSSNGSIPIDLLAAERAQARSAEDLARFLEIDKPLALVGVAFNQKSSEYALASAEEELAQLEKMYRAKGPDRGDRAVHPQAGTGSPSTWPATSSR